MQACAELKRPGPTLRRRVLRALDRTGGRGILAAAATWFARRATGADVEVYFDDFWIHRIGAFHFPDGPRFDYYQGDPSRWKGHPERCFSDAEEYWFWPARPGRGDVVLDVGAGRGEDVLAFSREVGSDGKVIAIEAHPATFELLRRFCQLNHLANTTPLHLAAMDTPGMVNMVETDDWQTQSVGPAYSAMGPAVRATTLDQVCEDLGITDLAFVKMNIEGAERFALKGMEKTLRHTRTICVACHDFLADQGLGEQFRTRELVEALLLERGFRLMTRRDDPRPYVRDHVFGLR